MVNPMAVASPAAASPTLRGIALEDFDGLMRNHQQRVYRVLLALLRDADSAATLTQDCFVRAFEKRASFRGEASVETWLVHIAVNLARDHMRSRRQGFWRHLFASNTHSACHDQADAHELALCVEDERPTAERVLLAQEKAAAVWTVVETLSPQQREVFVLRFVEELSLEEIAHALGLKTGTVKTHLSRATATVRGRLKESGSE
ncbi:MAG TPA: sigma-70 family RNA polymerase sigma factor [Clostridia bacterium]|nr:sigma-70 family RNA polymerase sigma factor [Clostridia bacterium]